MDNLNENLINNKINQYLKFKDPIILKEIAQEINKIDKKIIIKNQIEKLKNLEIKLNKEKSLTEIVKVENEIKEISQIPLEIPGLKYIPNYINKKEEKELIEYINSKNWIKTPRIKCQSYGYTFRYHRGKKYPIKLPNKIPKELEGIPNRVLSEKLINEKPDSLLINGYEIGKGIDPHIDATNVFKDTLTSISLISPCIMYFQDTIEKPKKIYRQILEPRSLLILKGFARYCLLHSIKFTTVDNYFGLKIPRKERISITYRNANIKRKNQ